jgi:hypothetical protein
VQLSLQSAMTTTRRLRKFLRACCRAPAHFAFICSFFDRGWLPDKSDQKNSFAMNGLLHTIGIGL